jgi:hypothetical protein
VAVVARRLVVAGQHEQIRALSVGEHRVKRRTRQARDALVVDGDLRGKLVGVHPGDEFAVEFLDEVFGRQLPDVADAR